MNIQVGQEIGRLLNVAVLFSVLKHERLFSRENPEELRKKAGKDMTESPNPRLVSGWMCEFREDIKRLYYRPTLKTSRRSPLMIFSSTSDRHTKDANERQVNGVQI